MPKYKKSTLMECYVDGGCNNQKNKGAYGSFAILSGDELIHSETFILDQCKTSNEAEYMSLIKLLEYITNYPNKDKFSWNITSDSKLMVNQINGIYRCSAKNLWILYRKSLELLQYIHKVALFWKGRKHIVAILGH
jgi:ribonuclease HI